MIKKKKILVVVCTHGDEKIGIEAVNTLIKREIDLNFEYTIGNPEAFKKNVRFTDTDQNRIAPGDSASNLYEERRVAELLIQAKEYDYIFDIHGTNSNSGSFIIIPKPTREKMILASQIPIKNIVIWESVTGRTTGPITDYVPYGLGIEFGPQKSIESLKEVVEFLEFINTSDFQNELSEEEYEVKLKNKNIFTVYGKLENTDLVLHDFQETELGGETFYPILVESYEHPYCYKSKKADIKYFLKK